MKTTTFEDKVRAMTAKEIIMAMVDGLKSPVVEVDMTTFGDINFDYDGKAICAGCAATNTICKIANVVLNKDSIIVRCDAVNSEPDFLRRFEIAIDNLRAGWIDLYNYIAYTNGFALISNPLNIKLPILRTGTYLENLQPYIDLANSQPSQPTT